MYFLTEAVIKTEFKAKDLCGSKYTLSSLLQEMAWCRFSAKPFSGSLMTYEITSKEKVKYLAIKIYSFSLK